MRAEARQQDRGVERERTALQTGAGQQQQGPRAGRLRALESSAEGLRGCSPGHRRGAGWSVSQQRTLGRWSGRGGPRLHLRVPLAE